MAGSMSSIKRPREGGTFTLCSSVIAKCGTESRSLCKNRLYEYDDEETWSKVLHDVLDGENFSYHKTDTVTPCVSDKLFGTVQFTPYMEEPIRIVKEFDRTLKYVTFTINRDKDVGLDPDNNNKNPQCATQSIFKIMMESCNSKKIPKLKDKTAANFTAKDQLFNELVQEFKEAGDGFPGSMSEKSLVEQLQLVVNAVWYISGNIPTITERSIHLPADVKPVPQRFVKYDCVNDFKKKKQKKPVLQSKDLKLHSQCLFGLSGRPFAQKWILKDDIEKLAVCLDQYSRYLDTANEKQKLRQIEMVPVRLIDDNISVQHHKGVAIISPIYAQLSNALNELNYYRPLYFDDQVHADKQFQNPDQRYKFF